MLFVYVCLFLFQTLDHNQIRNWDIMNFIIIHLCLFYFYSFIFVYVLKICSKNNRELQYNEMSGNLSDVLVSRNPWTKLYLHRKKKETNMNKQNGIK